MSFPQPRAFQVTAHESLREGFRKHHKNQMLMAFMGAGKTYCGLRLCKEALDRGKRAIFACDRTALIDQTSQRCDEYQIPHGVIQAQHWRYDPDLPMQVCSIQTVAQRGWPDADLIVIDEAHVQYRTWTQHAIETHAAVIGLSATPFSRGLGKVFQGLVNAITADELTRSGILVPMRVMSCTKPDMTNAKTAGGEWTNKAAGEREIVIVGDVVSEWCEHASNRKTIIFGATIAHCEEMARQFHAVGVSAEVYCSRTVQTVRDDLLSEFRKPDSSIRILLTVEALAKGVDVPDVECICDCRPLRKSLSAAMQMWGRGLRASPETGKKDCLLLDFSNNIVRFAKDFTDVFFHGLDHLDDGERLDREIRNDDDEEEHVKQCPQCGAIPFVGHCMVCGFQAQSASTVVQLPGHLTNLDLGLTGGRGAVAVTKQSIQSRESVYRQCYLYATMRSAHEKQRARAAHLYKDICGAWPPREYEHLGPAPMITQAVSGKIQRLNIAFHKSRKAA